MMRSLHLYGALPLACMIWLATWPAAAAIFNPSTSRPLTPGDNGSEDTLQEVFDAIVTSGSIDDELDQTAAAIFQPAGSPSLATFIISIAGLADSNKFGIYQFGDPDNRVEIFDGLPPDSQNTVEVTFEDGSVFLDGDSTKAQTGPDGSFGTAFGFYLEVMENGYWWSRCAKPYTLFSEDELNPIDADHSVDEGDAAQALIYRGKGQSLSLGSEEVTFDSTDIIIGWEDLVRGDSCYDRRLYGPSDGDFQDLVVLVEGVGTLPEPSSLIVWSLLAAVGITVGWRRTWARGPSSAFNPRRTNRRRQG